MCYGSVCREDARTRLVSMIVQCGSGELLGFGSIFTVGLWVVGRCMDHYWLPLRETSRTGRARADGVMETRWGYGRCRCHAKQRYREYQDREQRSAADHSRLMSKHDVRWTRRHHIWKITRERDVARAQRQTSSAPSSSNFERMSVPRITLRSQTTRKSKTQSRNNAPNSVGKLALGDSAVPFEAEGLPIAWTEQDNSLDQSYYPETLRWCSRLSKASERHPWNQDVA